MTCPQVELQLNALADQELPFRQASRVRRHLAACPACAAEFAKIQRLDTAVQAWRNAPAASSALGPRILAALPPSAALPTQRRPFPVRPAAAVGLASFAAALAAVFWFLPGQPGQPTIAYADVEKAMASVKTASWTEELTLYGADGKAKIHQVQQVWVRRNPAAIATITSPDTLHPYKRQTLEDTHGKIVLRPNGDYVLVASKRDVSSDVQGDLFAFGAALSPTAKSSAGLDSAEVKRTTLYGQSALRYTQTFHSHPALLITEKSQAIIWIDEKTMRCIKLKQRTSHNGKLWMVMTTDHVQYDQTPPLGLFDIVPPLGARVVDQRTHHVYRQGQPHELIK